MREIDLIPREHLQVRRFRRWIAGAGVAAALTLVFAAVARIAIEVGIARERPIVASLQRNARDAVIQRAQLIALTERHAILQARLDDLQRLREPAPWQQALGSVDTAFVAGLWFDQLAFSQSRVPSLADASASAVAADPAVPLSALGHTRQLFEIKGHAVDHAGVMNLINRLREQPGLRGVRLIDTGVRRYSMTEVIDFSIQAQVEAVPGREP